MPVFSDKSASSVESRPVDSEAPPRLRETFHELSANSLDAHISIPRITSLDDRKPLGKANSTMPEVPPPSKQQGEQAERAKPAETDRTLRQAGQALSLGMEMVVPALIGWWLDTLLVSSPVGVLTGGVMGFLLVLLHASRLIEPDKPMGKEKVSTGSSEQKSPPENTA